MFIDFFLSPQMKAMQPFLWVAAASHLYQSCGRLDRGTEKVRLFDAAPFDKFVASISKEMI